MTCSGFPLFSFFLFNPGWWLQGLKLKFSSTRHLSWASDIHLKKKIVPSSRHGSSLTNAQVFVYMFILHLTIIRAETILSVNKVTCFKKYKSWTFQNGKLLKKFRLFLSGNWKVRLTLNTYILCIWKMYSANQESDP